MSSHSGHIDIEKLEQVNKVYLQRALNDDPDLITEQAMKVLRKHLQSKYVQRNCTALSVIFLLKIMCFENQFLVENIHLAKILHLLHNKLVLCSLTEAIKISVKR